MSGIYIPGMEMPKSCLACEWCVHTIPADNFICYRLNRAVIGVAEEDVNETVNACCPLIPVPPHGRLIDADALLKKAHYRMGIKPGGIDEVEAFIRVTDLMDAPTIIPAEEGET